MSSNEHFPEHLRLYHGMHHLGLTAQALEIERSRAFKDCYRETITKVLGFDQAPTIIRSKTPAGQLADSTHHRAFLESFEASGHPPESAIRDFVDAELASRALAASGTVVRITSGQEVTACCLYIKIGWVSCNGFFLKVNEQPYTLHDMLVHYEAQEGRISDEAVRSELGAIRVFVQLEWDIAFEENKRAATPA